MSKRLGTWKLFFFFSYIFWAPHFFHLNHDMNIFPFNPFLLYIFDKFLRKKVFLFFCRMILLFFCNENFSFSHGTSGINKENSLNPSLSSCHTFLFLSNQASFIHFPLPGSNSNIHRTASVSFSVCVLSYLRFYLNGVDT